MNRFWTKVKKTKGCWLWTAQKDRQGYGFFWLNGRDERAHRVAWMLEHGDLPPRDQEVCHACDNPSCVNPAHLSLCTRQENTDDMVARNRQARVRGEAHGQSKLSEKDVTKIRDLRSTGVTVYAVAERFGINPSTVSKITLGKRRASTPLWPWDGNDDDDYDPEPLESDDNDPEPEEI